MPPLYARQHVLVLARILARATDQTHRSTALRCPHEAYLPAQQSPPRPYARISRPYGHPSWTPGARSSPRQGPQAPHGLSVGFAAALARIRLQTCQPRPDRFNRRSVSGINPNSIASTGTRAAPPTPASRSSLATAAVRFQDLDCRLPPAL